MAKKITYPIAGYLAYCNAHYCYFYNDRECPACELKHDHKQAIEHVHKKLKTAEDLLELSERRLKDEQERHKLTQLDAADYLTTKREVKDEVSERLG